MIRGTPALALALGGCVIGGDRFPRPRDLTDVWQVDKTRILAVRADPPEVRPGEVVRFSALIGRPPAETDPLSVVWFACPLDESAAAGCGGDLTGVDLENPDPEVLAELGLIGFEPLLPPVYTPPLTLLDALSPAERLEGTYVLVQTTVLPPEVLEDPEFELDPAELEASFKRLVVSEATTPNHNPAFAAFGVDGIAVSAETLVHVDPLQAYELQVVITPESFEQYEFLTSDGVVDTREEEPYVAWFTTGGELGESVTLPPYLDSTFVAPERSGTTGSWYAVARDRRGGMTWWVQRWVVD
jgi:hypothetical protein